ncbi:MAG: ABC transporter permease [Saprospiraceae bacterium]|nr:ABC transporter permease [Saprospiraceae bacterium]
MRAYFIKRLLFILPTLLILSVVVFFLSRWAPGDPVECGSGLAEISEISEELYLERYRTIQKNEGLEGPLFYFGIHSQAVPDTLYKIIPKTERLLNRHLIQQYGNWSAIQNWRNGLKNLKSELQKVPDSLQIEKTQALQVLDILKSSSQENVLRSNLEVVGVLLDETTFQKETQNLERSFEQMTNDPSRWKLWVPRISWYGFNNQYHNWISKILQGDFGNSCQTGQPVWTSLGPALKWTLLMTIPAILLSFLLAIPLGLFGALNAGTRFDKLSSFIVFVLYALPSFWVATLLLVFFTTPEYGAWLDWFPSIGLGRLPSTAPLWDRFLETTAHLILPVFCLTYASLAFISRQMRASILKVLPQPYVTTARAKGLSESQVFRKHVIKNSLFPIITILAGVLPAAISGSVVIEYIFNIPGMGRTTINAILARDWPVAYAIFFLGSILTILGLFLADLLYSWADPRTHMAKSQNPDS